MQCGTCSGLCPVSQYADFTPRQIVAMSANGARDTVLHSKMIWMCTSCYSCQARCPRGIPVREVMTRLRNLAIAKNVAPKEEKTFSEQFMKTIADNGRFFETGLIMKFNLLTNPLHFLRFIRVGLDMFIKNKITLLPEHIAEDKRIEKEMLLRCGECEHEWVTTGDFEFKATGPYRFVGYFYYKMTGKLITCPECGGRKMYRLFVGSTKQLSSHKQQTNVKVV
jgi:heterodisulfide reductase subunit C